MRLPSFAVAIVMAIAAPLEAQRAPAAYIAPTDRTVFTDIEESAGTVPGQTIWINNRSSVPIVVYSAALRQCENVKQRCSPMRLNIKVRPSSRAILLRVNPKNEFSGFSYSVSFGYRADSSNIAAIRVLADAGSADARARLEASAEADAERRRTIGASDVYLGEAELIALGAKVARMVTSPESVTVGDGRAFLLRDVRLLAVDSSGQLLGRVASAMRWFLPQTSVLLNRADTLLATGFGRVEIRFEAKVGERVLAATLPVIVVGDPPLVLSGGTASRRSRRPAAR